MPLVATSLPGYVVLRTFPAECGCEFWPWKKYTRLGLSRFVSMCCKTVGIFSNDTFIEVMGSARDATM